LKAEKKRLKPPEVPERPMARKKWGGVDCFEKSGKEGAEREDQKGEKKKKKKESPLRMT